MHFSIVYVNTNAFLCMPVKQLLNLGNMSVCMNVYTSW